MNKNKLICITGMPGAGKSSATDYLLAKDNFGYLRFGQVVLDRVKESGQKPSENLERQISMDLRQEYGMAAIAILNEPKICELLEKDNLVIDGLRSFEEYIYLKQKFEETMIVIAVFAAPKIRYDRLGTRDERHGQDEDLRFRSFTLDEAMARDIAEIERLNLGGTMAMADFTVINDAGREKLDSQMDQVLENIFNR
jgi:dephospho-CoA kinase